MKYRHKGVKAIRLNVKRLNGDKRIRKGLILYR